MFMMKEKPRRGCDRRLVTPLPRSELAIVMAIMATLGSNIYPGLSCR